MARDVNDTGPFVFGLDLTPRSRGALVFARWLRERLSPADVEALHMLRALDGPADAHAEELKRAQATFLERLGEHAGDFARAQVREASGIVQGIVDGLAQVEVFARALVIGRRGRSGERALVHLGSVARKLLRALPLPIVVVPPDLSAEALAGPIVIATDLAAHSETALRFAARLAGDLRRELVVAHVAEVHFNEAVDEADPGWIARREGFRRDAEADLRRWAEGRDLGDARLVALCGSPVELLLELVERERAALLVLGSRRLTTAERVFTTSTASTMAAYAACPIAVVPPPR